jgi:hypothetical protein
MTATARKTLLTTGLLLSTTIIIFLIAQGFKGFNNTNETKPVVTDTLYANQSYNLYANQSYKLLIL